jgi:hypothetical protein
VYCFLPIDNCIRPDAVHDAVRWCILPALRRLCLTLPFACTRFDRSIPAAAASITSGPALDAVSVVKCTEALPLDAYFTLIQVRPPCLTVAVAQLSLGPWLSALLRQCVGHKWNFDSAGTHGVIP